LKSECTYITELLPEYIDGLLDASGMAAVQGHLHECKDCNREYEILTSLVKKLGDIETVNAPADFLAKVHRKIERRSIKDWVRNLFNFSRFRIPIEAAAFALTAVLVLSLFYILPNEEKTKTTQPMSGNAPLTAGTEIRAARTSGDDSSTRQPNVTPPPVAGTETKQAVVKLTMSLNTTQTASPIPSQSVSYGNPETESENDFQDFWSEENDSTRKMLPIEINSKIDEVIKSVGGTFVSRKYKTKTGYPAHLAVEIPAKNYGRFISQIGNLGVLKTQAPALPAESPQDKVLIQLEFTAD
jgi:hypothetical protein